MNILSRKNYFKVLLVLLLSFTLITITACSPAVESPDQEQSAKKETLVFADAG